jgi:hypothetical protein
MSRKPTDDLLPNPFDEGASSAKEPPSAVGGPSLQRGPKVESSQYAKDLTPQQNRDAVLWPFINLENLGSKWWCLPQMLHSRGRHSMDSFAVQDMPPARQEFLELFIRFKSVSSHFMVIEANSYTYANVEEDSYGQLVSI